MGPEKQNIESNNTPKITNDSQKNNPQLQNGFSLSKLDNQTLNAIDEFGGLTLKNVQNNGSNEVHLTISEGCSINMNGKEAKGKTIKFDKDTLSIETEFAIGTGANISHYLYISGKNRDGTTDKVIIKKLINNESANKNTDISNNEKITDIITKDGKKVVLIENSTKDGDIDENYGYKGLVIDGERYNIVSGSVRRFRDGGTTYSTFEKNGKRFQLYQPSFFKNELPEIKTI